MSIADEPRYLIVKRGLYFRPNDHGYTGLKREAGRYPSSHACAGSGETAIHEDEAGEYSPACWEKTKLADKDRQIAELAALRHEPPAVEVEALVERLHPKERYHDKMTEPEIERLARDMCNYPDIRAPVQGFAGGIPWEMHMRAYSGYCAKYRGQTALINLYGRGCRGGFDTCELDMFIPGWRDELSERTRLLGEITTLDRQLTIAKGEAEALRAQLAEAREVIAQHDRVKFCINETAVRAHLENARDQG